MKSRKATFPLLACLIVALLASRENAVAFVSSPASRLQMTPTPPSSCSPHPMRRLPSSPRSAAELKMVHSLHFANLNNGPVHQFLSAEAETGPLTIQAGDKVLQHLPSAAGSAALLMSDVGGTGGGGGNIVSSVTSVLAAGFAIAAGIFVYANVVYTPEIIENASAMRQEEQTEQILALVKQIQRERGVEGVRDSRDALEKVFGMSVEMYIGDINRRMQENAVSARDGGVSVSDAEKELAELLRTIYL